MAPLKGKHICAKIKAATGIRWIVQKVKKIDCAIVRLPPGLMLALSDHLPMHSQVLLAQTCRSLRRVFHCIHPTGWHLSREESLELLGCFARDMPDRWVCEKCLKMHVRCQSDTPRISGHSSCPQGSSINLYEIGNIQFSHHHIQLCLKYARMRKINKTQHQYLDAILASHVCACDRSFYRMNGIVAQYSLRPKIVHGNFLINSTTHFDQAISKVLPENLRSWNICTHQRLMGWHSSWAQTQMLCRPLKPEYFLWDTVLEAFEAKDGAELHASCPLCPTDFSFQVREKRATLRVWVDLGPESSPLNEFWKIRAGKDRKQSPGISNEEPGRVRRLYESERGRTARPKVVLSRRSYSPPPLLEPLLLCTLSCPWE